MELSQIQRSGHQPAAPSSRRIAPAISSHTATRICQACVLERCRGLRLPCCDGTVQGSGGDASSGSGLVLIQPRLSYSDCQFRGSLIPPVCDTKWRVTVLDDLGAVLWTANLTDAELGVLRSGGDNFVVEQLG